MEKKKILLLGGSAQQVVAIKTAEALGYYTVLIDYLPDNPGQYVADKYYSDSTTDVEAVYRIAKEEKVSGILAYASDPAALPAAIVAERLGLPTNPSKSVAILGVKDKFREFLHEHDFACPKFYTFSPNDDIEEVKSHVNDFTFPIVVKPTDSSGSKGVSKLQDLDNLGEAIKDADGYSRNKVLIAEEFIQRGFPEVIGGDIFIWNGKIILYGEMSCLRGNHGRGLVPIGEKRPSGLNIKQLSNIHKELQRLISKLGVKFGEMNIEIILDKNDNVHFLEVGPRAGGNMIPIQLSDAFGCDLVKANVLAAMGENPQLDLQPKDGCFMTYVLHSYDEGIFKDVHIDESLSSHVYRKVVYKKEGDQVESFDGAGKAVGILFLHFESETEMDTVGEKMEELVHVELEEP